MVAGVVQPAFVSVRGRASVWELYCEVTKRFTVTPIMPYALTTPSKTDIMLAAGKVLAPISVVVNLYSNHNARVIVAQPLAIRHRCARFTPLYSC